MSVAPELERALIDGHPWVYREQLQWGPGAAHGAWVWAVCGRFQGVALYDAKSAIALRIYSRIQVPDAGWLLARVKEAWELRKPLMASGTNAFRWLYGEADGLPGVVADFYAGYVVVAPDGDATQGVVELLVSAFVETAELKGVALRRREAEGPSSLERLWGRLPPKNLVVQENHLRLRANLFEGQKTGLFLDHRENRERIGRLAKGKRVLNLFAYSGAFSLYAAHAGASTVTSVDIAPGASEDALENFKLNGLSTPHQAVTQDVFEYLEQARARGQRFDLVVCDPPSFARSNKHIDKAILAYSRVNAAGLRVTELGGLYAAASCTGRVSPQKFHQSVRDASRRAGVRFLVLADLGHASDHPVSIGHPEGRYLKFLLGRVLARC